MGPAQGAARPWPQPQPQPTHRLPVCPSLQSIHHRMLDLLFEKIEMMEYISMGRKLFFFSYREIGMGIISPDSVTPIK